MRACSRILLALALGTATAAMAQLQRATTIVLIGPPGSGKSTQAEYLRKRFKVPAVSMSQLLDREVNRKTPMGKALAASLSSGELLADGPANELMMARLLAPDVGRGFILDGYPTTEGQARALDQWIADHNLPRPTVVVLDVGEDVSRNRMSRRRRADDARANIERRLSDYREAGKLVEQWYGAESVVRIDGAGTPSEIAQRIANGLEAVQARRGLKRRAPEESGLEVKQDP